MSFKPLAREDLDNTLAHLSRCADESGVRLVLAGGNAMAHYGSPRMTGDIDILAESIFDAECALADASDLGAVTFGGLKGRLAGVEVDVLVRDDDYAELYSDAVEFAQPLPGTSLFIVGPEYLAAMKLAADRPKDMDDLEYLLTAERLGHLPRALDEKKARRIVEAHLGTYGARTFDHMAEEARLFATLPNPSRRRRRKRR